MSFDTEAVGEPEYSGLLTVAPTAVGDVEGVVDRFGEYRAQLTELVGNVVTLYRTAQGLPTFDPDDGTVRVLHVSDIHNNPQAFDLIELLVDQFDIDAVADTGDITDWGTEPETRLLDRIEDVGVPYVWVRGNHDSATTQRAVAGQPNAVVLDGDPATVAGLRFWGVADTRYTPNKDQPTGRDVEREQAEAVAPEVAERPRRRRTTRSRRGDGARRSHGRRHRRRSSAGARRPLPRRQRGLDRGHAAADRGLDGRCRTAGTARRGARTADVHGPVLRSRHQPARRV